MTLNSGRMAEQRRLPVSPDVETLTLLRSFLGPIIEGAQDWQDLCQQMECKGFGLTFLHGHLVILNIETGASICTGAMLGTPLHSISQRLGRPAVRANPDGISGQLALAAEVPAKGFIQEQTVR